MEPQNVETIDQLLNRYLQDSPPASAKWRNEVERIFRANVRPAIGEKKLNTVKRTDVLAIVNAMKDRGAGVAANRTLAAIRRAFNWAVAEEYMDANPAARIPRKVKEDPRNRALGEAEIRAFWLGLDDAPMTAGIKLALRIALTTGQRIGEILRAPRSEVDLGRAEWLIPASRAKNGREHLVPLSPLAIELFHEARELSTHERFIFPNRAKCDHLEVNAVGHALRRALPQLGLADAPATAHDLRRTVASNLARMGTPEAVIAHLLNHKSEFEKTITSRVYNQHAYAAEKRQALEAWATVLADIIEGRSGPKGNVARMQR
jgi:integrase